MANSYFLPLSRLHAIPVVLFVVALTVSSCEKPSRIGLSVQPPGDKFSIFTNDTTRVFSFTVREDSIRTDESGYNLLGGYSDPVFGNSYTGFYTQFELPANNINFGTPFSPDSIVLTIGYSGNYGTAPTSQSVKVYELSESVYIDSTYYSNRDFAYNPTELTNNAVIQPQTGDSVISLRLNSVFLNKFATSDSTNFIDNAAFWSFFKGLYITTDTNQTSSVLYLNLLSAYTKLTIYYNSTSLSFITGKNSARINRFKHNYSGTPIAAQFADSSLGDSLCYVQALAGVKTKISMPHLQEWSKTGNIAINKAELIFKPEANSYDTYNVPDDLFLLGIGNDDETIIVIDQYEGESYFGGAFDKSAGEYRLNITRHIHSILQGNTVNNGFYLIVPNNLKSSGSAVSANRVVLYGGGNSNGIRLRLTYTKI